MAVNFIVFKKKKKVYFERECVCANGEGAEREGEREGISSRVCAASTEPVKGLEPTNQKIMT